jgi:hypothetical protein
MTEPSRIEIDNIPCCFCGKDCPTEWAIDIRGLNLGMLSSEEFMLFGDNVCHYDCLDMEMVKHAR